MSEHLGVIRRLGSSHGWELHVFSDALVVARAAPGPFSRAFARGLAAIRRAPAGSTAVAPASQTWGSAAELAARHPRNRLLYITDIGSAKVTRVLIGPPRSLNMVLSDHTDRAFTWSSLNNRDDVVRPLLQAALGEKLEWRV